MVLQETVKRRNSENTTVKIDNEILRTVWWGKEEVKKRTFLKGKLFLKQLPKCESSSHGSQP